MAKICEDVVVIKLSKLVKDTEAEIYTIISPEVHSSIEQLVQELVGENVIVEVVKA